MSYTLRDFGSYTVGGHLHHVTEGTPREVQFTRSASYTYDPRGHFAVGQTYVQYFVPDRRRDAPPMVLIHGGGMTGSTWETTPDGRPGWLHLLLDRGYEVHVVDLVERGRAGFAAGIWQDAPILRSAEEAWALFRFGPTEGFRDGPFADQKFPVEFLDDFLRRVVPRWLTTTLLQTAGLVAVLDNVGEATLICHSQGAEIAFDAYGERPEQMAGIIAVEPSALPPTALACPLTIVAGDYLDTAAHWAKRQDGWRAAVAERPGRAVYLDSVREIAPGGSHFLMMDRHNSLVLEAALEGF